MRTQLKGRKKFLEERSGNSVVEILAKLLPEIMYAIKWKICLQKCLIRTLKLSAVIDEHRKGRRKNSELQTGLLSFEGFRGKTNRQGLPALNI